MYSAFYSRPARREQDLGAELETAINDWADALLHSRFRIVRPNFLDVLEPLALSDSVYRVLGAVDLEGNAAPSLATSTPSRTVKGQSSPNSAPVTRNDLDGDN